MPKQKHHTWPKRHRQRGTHEIKFVTGKAHRLWHMLVADLSPEEAIRYIADNFLPSEYCIEVRKL